MTALFFFTVLSWYNFILAVYVTLTTTDSSHQDQTLQTLGFAILWTILVIVVYYLMFSSNLLESGINGGEHPLLRDDLRGNVSLDSLDLLRAV